MAKELDSPDVQVRLQALDRWVQQEHTGSVDPLMLALTDPDERVQARALALIEEDWVRAQVEER
jgi:HEAT repeat protein